MAPPNCSPPQLRGLSSQYGEALADSWKSQLGPCLVQFESTCLGFIPGPDPDLQFRAVWLENKIRERKEEEGWGYFGQKTAVQHRTVVIEQLDVSSDRSQRPDLMCCRF